MRNAEEAAFLREVFARLPTADCAGCYDCAERCVGNLRITWTEFAAIRDYLDGGGWFPVSRGMGEMMEPCEFQEPGGVRCVIYPVRPLICRLFGLVQWLPCPRRRLPVLVPEGPQIVAAYAEFERHSFREWLRRGGND